MPGSQPSGPDVLAAFRAAQSATVDEWRRVQARTLDLFGFGVRECDHRVVATGHDWHLRRYGDGLGDVPILLVPASIKRPYIWDLSERVSPVRFCLDHGFDVHLLEWLPPTNGSAGLEDYARTVSVAAERVGQAHAGRAPFILGHSLGGTLAAIASAMAPDRVRGLVLLGAPLSFEPGSSAFRDTVVANGHGAFGNGTVAGSQLSQFCALVAPGSFVWERSLDAFLSVTDPVAFDIHVRIERWALDEVPLSSLLVREIVEWLYRENRFQHRELAVAGRKLGPQDLICNTLAVVNEVDEVGPRASVEPFFALMDGVDREIFTFPPEIGVGLQHLAVLAGRRARAETWPRIAEWITDRA